MSTAIPCYNKMRKMEKISTVYKGGRVFENNVRGHKIVADLPLSGNGTDTGPTPPDLLVMSLTSCIGFYVVFYCEKYSLDPQGLTIEAEYEKSVNKIERISVRFSLPSAQTEHVRKGALAWAEKCLIHKTLCEKPDIKISLA